MRRWSIRGYMLAVGYSAALLRIGEILLTFFASQVFGGH
jgi:hypothetical protein